MIHFCEEHPIVNKLMEMEETFYLIGSRFMGTAKQNSDYDFYVCPKGGECSAMHTELVEKLVNVGFKKIQQGGRGYCDDMEIWNVMSWSATGRGLSIPDVDVLITSAKVIAKRLCLLTDIKKKRFFELSKVFKNEGLAFYQFCKFIDDSGTEKIQNDAPRPT